MRQAAIDAGGIVTEFIPSGRYVFLTTVREAIVGVRRFGGGYMTGQTTEERAVATIRRTSASRSY
jgi:hypothetical protein